MNNKAKIERLKAKGYEFHEDATAIFDLSQEDAEMIDLHVRLAIKLKQTRTAQHMTQAALAKRLASSQSRIARMESADPGVTIDALIRALFSLGLKTPDLIQALA